MIAVKTLLITIALVMIDFAHYGFAQPTDLQLIAKCKGILSIIFNSTDGKKNFVTAFRKTSFKDLEERFSVPETSETPTEGIERQLKNDVLKAYVEKLISNFNTKNEPTNFEYPRPYCEKLIQAVNEPGLDEDQSGLDEGQSGLDEGQSVLDEGQSVLDEGQSVLDEGQSVLDEGQSVLDEGQSVLDEGQSVLDEGQSGNGSQNLSLNTVTECLVYVGKLNFGDVENTKAVDIIVYLYKNWHGEMTFESIMNTGINNYQNKNSAEKLHSASYGITQFTHGYYNRVGDFIADYVESTFAGIFEDSDTFCRVEGLVLVRKSGVSCDEYSSDGTISYSFAVRS